MHCALGPIGTNDHYRHVAAGGDQLAIGVAGQAAIADPNSALEVGLDERLIRDLRRAADMEGAHRQLSARLADGLSRDDADRFAVINGRTAREVAAIARGADAVL